MGQEPIENSFSSLLLELQEKHALSEYCEYLLFDLNKAFIELSNELKEQSFSLIEVLNSLSSPPETDSHSSAEPILPLNLARIEKIGIQLLIENRISLSEINVILCHLPNLQLKYFLHHLLKHRKIKTEDFLSFLKECSEDHFLTETPSPYALRISPTLEFYVSFSETNKKYGSYQVLEEIGRGGMGVVYKGYHPHLNRIVALKVLLSGSSADEEEIQRFHREVEIMAKLQHENIVQIYDAGVEDHKRYLAMEYIEGDALTFSASELTLREKVSIIRDTLLGLEYAHRQGIIHRDLKLDNILILPHLQPKIADFGLARITNNENEKRITSSGVILGTANYMAPEQALGRQKEINEQTDLYSIGICLYRILTQHYPFEAESLPHLLVRIVKDEPTPPSKYLPLLQKDLENILLKSLEKEKGNRYRSAADFAEDLTRFLQGVPFSPPHLFSRWRKKVQQYRIFIFFMTFFLCCLLYTQYIWWQEKQQLFIGKFQEASLQEKRFLQNSTNVYLGLQTWTSLNDALRLKEKDVVTEQKKWDIGEILLQQVLREGEHHLGDYLIQEMQLLSSIPQEKRDLRETLWQTQKNKKWQEEEKQFEKWLSFLSQEPFEDIQGKDALYEIAKMSTPVIPKKIIALLREGNLFFTSETFYQYREKTNFYIWCVRLLEKMRIVEALPFIIEGLSNIVAEQSQYKPGKQNWEKMNYLVELVKYLVVFEVYSQADFLFELQVAMGENSLYTTRTTFLLKKLYQQKLSRQKNKKLQNEIEYLLSGRQRHLAGDFKGAISDFDAAIDIRPTFAEAYYYRGITSMECKDFERAIADLNEAIFFHPQDAFSYHQRGIVKHYKKDFEEAIQDFSEAIRLKSQFAEAFYYRGESKRERQYFQEAIQDFSQAIQLNSQFVEAYFARGNAKKEIEDMEGAITDFEEAIRLNPKFANAYYQRGMLKQVKKDFEGAIQDFGNAIATNPRFAEAYYSRGRVKGELKDFNGAITDYLEAIRINPQFAIPDKKQKEKEKKDFELEIEKYTETIRLAPKSAEGYFHRGSVKYYQKQMEEAIADYSEAIHLDPKLAKAYFYRGHAKCYQKDVFNAIFDFNETIRLDPKFVEAYFYRGYFLWNEKYISKEIVKKDFFKFIQLLTEQKTLSLYSQQLDWIYEQFPELR